MAAALPLGKTKFRGDFGAITFDYAFASRMVENFQRDKANYLGSDDGFGLPITFSHVGPSLPSNEKRVEDLRAAGWIQDVQLRRDGIYVLTKWVQEAKQRIGADEFRFLSPEFVLNDTDINTGQKQGPTLLGAALLNDPFLKEMPRVAAASTPAMGMKGLAPVTPVQAHGPAGRLGRRRHHGPRPEAHLDDDD